MGFGEARGFLPPHWGRDLGRGPLPIKFLLTYSGKGEC